MTERRQQIGLLSASLLGGLASLLLACGPPPPPPAPEVEYNSCQTVSFPGPLCALWPTQPLLRLWVKVDPGTEVEIRADGKRQEVTGEEPSEGGRRFKLWLGPKTRWLTVRLRQPGGLLSSPWALKLVPSREPEWGDEIRKLAVIPNRKAELHQRLADLWNAVPRKGERKLIFWLGVQSQDTGRDDEAEAWLLKSILADQREGMLSEEVEQTTRLARIYMKHGRFGDARRVLTNLRIPPRAPADSQYLAAYYRGLLADWIGDYGSALDELQQANELAERGGMDQQRLESGQVLARILEELGLSKESEGLFTRLRAIPRPQYATPCDEGSLLTNEAWSKLLVREAGERADDPTPMLKEAQADFAGPCARPDQQLIAHLNLTLADQQAKRWPEARQALSAAEAPSLASHATLDQHLWLLDLQGRQAIAEGDLAIALQLYRELAGMARETSSVEGSFRAAVGRAHVQQKLGRPADAILSFKEADRLIDELAWHIPASEGRDTFVGQREAAMRQYLQLLLDSRQRGEAFELVRRDRSRLLRQLAVKDRLAHMTPDQQRLWDAAMSKHWRLHAQVDRGVEQEDELPGDELKSAVAVRDARLKRARKELDDAIAELGDPGKREESQPSPPRPGEVILAYHPLPDGWAGFAATRDGIQVSFFELPDDVLAHPEALAPKLIGPFQPLLERAARVRVLPFGRLRSVDFHALPLAGKPLLAWLPVVYGLDVPADPSPTPAGLPVALLVASPEGNLPDALQESRSIAATIRGWGHGWTPKLLEGKDAGAGAVRDALPGASLFEFAGHGELAGLGGWESALRLAAGSRLTPGDVLTLRVPAWVVLSTCEGGSSSREAPGEGIGLAQAFLLAGSRAVVAAVRPVRDATARDFVIELHRHWQPGMDLKQPFRQAQLACLQSHPDDCASFRLFEP